MRSPEKIVASNDFNLDDGVVFSIKELKNAIFGNMLVRQFKYFFKRNSTSIFIRFSCHSLKSIENF